MARVARRLHSICSRESELHLNLLTQSFSLFQTRAKFDLERTKEALQWVEAITGEQLEPSSEEIKDQLSVKQALKSGVALCQLVNIFLITFSNQLIVNLILMS